MSRIRRSTKSDRNRAILLAHQEGSTIEQLAEVFGLAILTVRSIIYHERHKVEVSMDDFDQAHGNRESA